MVEKKAERSPEEADRSPEGKEDEPSWDEIGTAIGKKIEKASQEGKFDCKSWGVKHKVKSQGSGGCFYFLGFVGALVYYVTTASGGWGIVIGFLKALVWPAFLVYGAFQFLGL